MPFNSSNVFQRLYNWVTGRDNSVQILAERVNADTDDIVAGINKIMSGEADFIGQLKGVNGTASAPAWSFTDDPDSGFYRAVGNTIGVSTGGVKKVEISGLETRFFNNLVVNAGTITNIQLNNSTTSQSSFPTPDASVGAPPKIEGEYKDGYVGVVLNPKQTVNYDLAITMKEGDEGGPQWWADAVEYKVWTENNDGAGSGLDADLLDGKQALDFVNQDGPYARLAGSGAGYVNSYLALAAQSDTNYRGTGVFCYDEGGQVEWYFGRPYSVSDAFTVNRKTGVGSAQRNGPTADPANSPLKLSNQGVLTVPNQPACVVSRGTGWELGLLIPKLASKGSA